MLSWSLGRNGASTRFLLGFLSPCRTARRSRQRFCAFWPPAFLLRRLSAILFLRIRSSKPARKFL